MDARTPVKLPRLRGLSVSIVLHVAGVALALALLREPASPALFIDLTRPLDGSATDGAGASPTAAPVSSAPSAGSASRRGPATRARARPSVAPAPSPMSEPSAAPAAPRRAEPAVAASPPAPTEVPASTSPVLPPPAPAASPSSAPSGSAGGAAAGAVDAAAGGSETVSTPTSPGFATFAPTPSSAGTGTGSDTTRGDQRGPGTTALAVPGEGGRAGAEYAAYLALVRRRIQESLRYPVAARRRGLAGSVHVEITVEPSGRIAAVSLVASSSHPLLDEAALEAVRGLPRLPFPPDVAPRLLRVRLPVVFELR